MISRLCGTYIPYWWMTNGTNTKGYSLYQSNITEFDVSSKVLLSRIVKTKRLHFKCQILSYCLGSEPLLWYLCFSFVYDPNSIDDLWSYYD